MKVASLSGNQGASSETPASHAEIVEEDAVNISELNFLRPFRVFQ